MVELRGNSFLVYQWQPLLIFCLELPPPMFSASLPTLATSSLTFFLHSSLMQIHGPLWYVVSELCLRSLLAAFEVYIRCAYNRTGVIVSFNDVSTMSRIGWPSPSSSEKLTAVQEGTYDNLTSHFFASANVGSKYLRGPLSPETGH